MDDDRSATPDATAVRVALWRAVHTLVDPPPHVLEDDLGLRLAALDAGWRRRPDMDPRRTARSRASIVARARFVEDLVEFQASRGVRQYVLLGAGLDTFAQRRPDLAAGLRVFEVDRPGPQAWKRRRLTETGLGIPACLRFVPADLDGGVPWWERLAEAGFDARQPTVVASTGVSMYLSAEANAATLHRLAGLAPGSSVVMSFMLPLDRVEAGERPLLEATERAARAHGVPFLSFFSPEEILTLAREAGLLDPRRIGATELAERYFSGRADGLRPSSAEELLLATT